MIALTRARGIVTPGGVLEGGALLADAGRIAEIGPAVSVPPGAEVCDAEGLTLLPGFLDLHIHGGGGADVMDASPDALETICRTHARHGTTGLLATTMTQEGGCIDRALAAARAAREAGAGFCPHGARILGVHLEGPYLCPARAGAQPTQWIRAFEENEFAGWLETAGGAIKLLTCAPEQPGGEALIAAARAAGSVVSLGHTDADTAQTRAAIAAGVTHVTHLFNQMRPLHHREPGPVGVALADARVRAVELIADGQHVAPDVVGLAVRAKGIDGVVLITDAMAGAGAGDGFYHLGGNPVTVAGGRATLADGTLAGSVLTMDRAAANVRAWLDLDWPAVARLTATNAADAMGWSGKGRLTVGADADFVLVDDDLNVHATFVAGRCVFRMGDG